VPICAITIDCNSNTVYSGIKSLQSSRDFESNYGLEVCSRVKPILVRGITASENGGILGGRALP
jgi:hypothetical protein